MPLDLTTRDVCPAAPGAISAGAAAFSTEVGLLFIPANFLCMDLRPHFVSFIPGTPFTGTTVRIKPIPGQPRGALLAWDIAAAKAVWEVPERFPIYSGVLATAGCAEAGATEAYQSRARDRFPSIRPALSTGRRRSRAAPASTQS